MSQRTYGGDVRKMAAVLEAEMALNIYIYTRVGPLFPTAEKYDLQNSKPIDQQMIKLTNRQSTDLFFLLGRQKGAWVWLPIIASMIFMQQQSTFSVTGHDSGTRCRPVLLQISSIIFCKFLVTCSSLCGGWRAGQRSAPQIAERCFPNHALFSDIEDRFTDVLQHGPGVC